MKKLLFSTVSEYPIILIAIFMAMLKIDAPRATPINTSIRFWLDSRTETSIGKKIIKIRALMKW